MAPTECAFCGPKIQPLRHDAPCAYANGSGQLYSVVDAEEVRRGLPK
jgi:hypothetical protein